MSENKNENEILDPTEPLDETEFDPEDEEETEVEDLRGPRPGIREAIRNKCFNCCGDMIDGRQDCQLVTCSLYYWQPYRKLKPNLSWRTEGSHLAKNRAALQKRVKTAKSGQEDSDA